MSQADPSIHGHRALLVLQQGKDTGTDPGDGRDSGTNLILAVLGLNQRCLCPGRRCPGANSATPKPCKKLEGNSAAWDILGCLERGFFLFFFLSTGGKGGFSSYLDNSQEILLVHS